MQTFKMTFADDKILHEEKKPNDRLPYDYTYVKGTIYISHPAVGTVCDPLQDQESWQLVAVRGDSLLALPMAEGSCLVPGHTSP